MFVLHILLDQRACARQAAPLKQPQTGCTDLDDGVGQVIGAGQGSSGRAPYARDALYVRLRGRLQTQDLGFRV